MFLSFFANLRAASVPVTPREYLTLMQGMERGLASTSVEDFYHLARACLIKDERNLDKFDLVFGATFKGLQSLADGPDVTSIPDEWLRKLAEKYLTDAEKSELKALGFDKLMETLRQRLAEQKERHQGGSKWIGTAGTSPFGAYGYHPEGVRIGQDGNRNFRAGKVWDKREFRDLDGGEGLGQRNMRMALRRLRKFARTGAADELDIDTTISQTAEHGYLDIKLRPERRNAMKVLLLFDIGGSMDWHISQAEALFSAARSEFKHMHQFYFHNCVYENLWTRNDRRRSELTPVMDVIHTYPRDTRVIIVGDAAMSPHEIIQPGGSVEHMNPEPGAVWMERLARAFPALVWLNPVSETSWGYTHSIQMMQRLTGGRMFPLTLDGLDRAMRQLVR